MKAEIINVTPQMASDWLAMNLNNRPLRRSMVEGLKAAFLRGEYIQTHQGIAFSENGELLDGQHRLTAISELRDGSFPMVVSTGVVANAFQVMDIGAKRSPADALRNDDRRVVEVARLIGAICQNKKSSVTPMMLIPIIEAIQHQHDMLIAFCPSSVKAWSTAPVRLAAVVSLLSGANPDYVKTTYRALVLADFDGMSQVARALYKAHINGSVRSGDAYDMLARCLVVFNERKAANTKIQIKDTSEAIARIKSGFSFLIPDAQSLEKKKATPKGVAKSVLQLHSNRLG